MSSLQMIKFLCSYFIDKEATYFLNPMISHWYSGTAGIGTLLEISVDRWLQRDEDDLKMFSWFAYLNSETSPPGGIWR